MMHFNAEVATQQAQKRMKNLYQLVHKIEEVRQRNEHSLANVAKVQEKNSNEEKVSPYYQQKYKNTLKAALADNEHEEELLRNALQCITEIRAIKNDRRIHSRNPGGKETIRKGPLMKMLAHSAQTLPLHVGKYNEKPPPLCGAIPAENSYVAKVGDMVAALVDENWILAEVLSYSSSTNKYEVYDIDEEQNSIHTISRRTVAPLPLMRANPETDPGALFPKGSVVMALYPQTTCFYKAVVNQLPMTHIDEYEVLFEDFNFPEGYSPPSTVAQRYVIAIKQRNKT